MPADVVVLEGILVLHMEEIREMLNMKVYVDTDDDVRLARRCGLRCGASWLACTAGGVVSQQRTQACGAAALARSLMPTLHARCFAPRV